MTKSADDRTGSVLENKYDLIRILGEGGMGKVYEARHRTIGRRVAVKFLLPQYAANRDVVRRFENEARTAGTLEHENVAAVLDFGQASDGAYYLVMEYLDGEDTERLLTREGQLPVPRAINIMLQVCRGLAAAHERTIIHRDLKPANLFLLRRADGAELVKILDFGIAKLRLAATDADGTAMTAGPIGTAYYMSPEQARGDKELDHRSDLYALGVILYELLAGQRPHDGDSVLQIIHRILTSTPAALDVVRPGLPKGLTQIVAKAMAFEPSQRFASAKELGAALEAVTGRSELARTAFAAAETVSSPDKPAHAIKDRPPALTTNAAVTPPIKDLVPRTSLRMPVIVVAGGIVLLGAGAFMLRRGAPEPAHALVAMGAPKPQEPSGEPAAATPAELHVPDPVAADVPAPRPAEVPKTGTAVAARTPPPAVRAQLAAAHTMAVDAGRATPEAPATRAPSTLTVDKNNPFKN
jgi:serine/threonine-protein kinase